jgi:hypothetical protein
LSACASADTDPDLAAVSEGDDYARANRDGIGEAFGHRVGKGLEEGQRERDFDQTWRLVMHCETPR